ncbi:MAG: rhodanese-like domain-containing protein [Myxococcota bacterium]|mgnify:CR=1 FL=1
MRSWFVRGIIIGSGVAVVLVGVAWRSPAVRWTIAEILIDGDQPTLSPDELARALQRDDAPLLLDVRSLDEYRVSRIPGAIHFPPGAPIDLRIERASSVVAYCSVGVRSGWEVARLRDRGIAAKNLEGAIFLWASEGRPLVDDHGPTKRVHGYNRFWERALPAERRNQ